MSKKGDVTEIFISDMDFPNRAYGYLEGHKTYVKYAYPGQRIRGRIIKKRKNKWEASLLEVLTPAPEEIMPACSQFGVCGGCSFLNVDYAHQLALKERLILKLFQKHDLSLGQYEGILGSPQPFGYKNKMEFSFGDGEKDGPLLLGMHKRDCFYDVVDAGACQIVDEDFRLILNGVRDYFSPQETYFHKKTHEGYLRHLVIRKGKNTGEIMVNLVTVKKPTQKLTGFVSMLLALPLEGKLKSVLHTENDSVGDVIQADSLTVLYGEEEITESLLGLRFKISPFSFFQTNTWGAEVLYQKVREYVGDLSGKVVFDLYSGTGTIAQIVAAVAKEVYAVEIVAEAVEKAKENARENGISNCRFIAGDVLAEVEHLGQKPDVIILDPPRAGIHPKALTKIIEYGPKEFVYVSCKASSLAEELPAFLAAGYRVEKSCLVDMFAGGYHVETVVLMSRVDK